MTGVSQSAALELMATLRRSTGTVTDFLEHLAGEPIDADVLSQDAGPAGNDNSLGLVSDAEILRRSVLLTGRASGRRFVYAESAIAMERLPDPVRQRLELSRDPIGRVLTDHGIPVRRDPLAGPVVAVGDTARIARLLDGAALSRRYRITLRSDTAIVVSEWFLPTVFEAIASGPRPSSVG
jgi:chorismate lyase